MTAFKAVYVIAGALVIGWLTDASMSETAMMAMFLFGPLKDD